MKKGQAVVLFILVVVLTAAAYAAFSGVKK
jgi:uncharacterized membrane protein